MGQALDYASLVVAQSPCPGLPSPAEWHGQICGLLCGLGSVAPVDAYLRDWARDAEDRPDENLMAMMQVVAARSHAALSGAEFDFEPLLPDDTVGLDARVTALAEWAQGFLFGVVEAGAVWSVAPAAVREVITDFAEIARLRGGGLDDEDDEGAYAELVEYVRMGAMLVYGEQAPEGAAGGRPG